MMRQAVTIAAIVAMDSERVIGADNSLPWHLPEDLKHFKSLTQGGAVMMGRKTYDSLPAKSRPLPGRVNIVCTRSPQTVDPHPQVRVISNPRGFLEQIRSNEQALASDRLWVAGGATIYSETMDLWDELYLTRIHSTHSGDAFFPPFEEMFDLLEREEREGFSFERYARKRCD